MFGNDFDKAALTTEQRQENSRALVKALGNSPETVDTEKALNIVARGIDANMRFDDGNTLLIHAGYAGNSDVICALLASGADPNLANKRSETPLHYATKAMLPKAVKALLEHGADIYARDEFRKTAQEMAEGTTPPGGKTMALARAEVLKLLNDAVQTRIRRDMDAALFREEMQVFTDNGCATRAEVKPMKAIKIKPQGDV